MLPELITDSAAGGSFAETLSRYSLFSDSPDGGGARANDTRKATDINSGSLILINSENPYVFPDDPTEGMVNIYDNSNGSYGVTHTGMVIAEEAMQPLNDMMAAFVRASGLNTVYVSSAYRAYDEQRELYEADRGSYSEGEPIAVAEPGQSEHHAGLAVDLGLIDSNGSVATFDGEGVYSWFKENAHLYGFILRYTDAKSDITGIIDEPWHFRYVGVAHAELMYIHGLCLEEYIDWLHELSDDGGSLTHYSSDGNTYEISYNAGDAAAPADAENCSVSGDNISGRIITVLR